LVVTRVVYRPTEYATAFARKTARVRAALTDGHGVVVAVQMRGREVAHPELAEKMVKRITDALLDVPFVVRRPSRPRESTIERVLVPGGPAAP
jgi:translation initiation factor IF-3